MDLYTINIENWKSCYSSLIESNTLPMLNVGADETQVSLCWHAPKQTASAQVMLSVSKDMADARLFECEITEAENDFQSVCRVNITGLKENTTYFYQWNTGNGWSDVEKYETKSFTSHKAVIFGDIQITEIHDGDNSAQISESNYWNNLLEKALADNAEIAYLLSPGDNTSTGKTAEEWQSFLMPPSLRSLPLALAIGNHDKKGKTYHYYTNMPNEYYGKGFFGLDRDFWFRYGDVLYLVFDSTSGSAPDHIAMAKEAVAKNRDARWRIGLVHHGIYGAGDCIGDKETEILLNSIFTPIFESFDLDLVITGHTHSQGRSHFMKKRKIVGRAENGKTYPDPDGIVYINANSVCGKVVMDYEADYLAYAFMENDVTTYTTLEYKGNQLILQTRRGDSGALLDSITLERTRVHNENSTANKLRRITYKPIEFAGWAYNRVTKLLTK
ncbi:MAG: metallophosphoesterase family protein [Clostridia bacterium]|nr:metallophosphoesterase family protein [Clostridia bacterium]